MALENDIDVLLAQPLLSVMPREALRLIAFAAETRFLRAGDILFRKNETADCAYLLTAGMIALDARDDGSPAMQIAGPGSLLGETALFAEVQRPATAIARETSTVMRLNRSVMARVLGEFPDTAALLHQAISARVQGMAHDLGGVRDRLMAIDR
ncbi:MAG: cyclic nucleotide-binding domain-containing protein [Bosea sp. (in: a-proteobacteria)]